jgi:hypothetical protein
MIAGMKDDPRFGNFNGQYFLGGGGVRPKNDQEQQEWSHEMGSFRGKIT